MKSIAKTLCSIALACCLTLTLAGCPGDGKDKMIYAWPVATGSPEDTVTHIMAETFAQECMRLSGGRIKMKVYGNSLLGNDRELLESCEGGDIPFIVQTTAPQIDFVPETAVFDYPCAFPTLADLRKTVNDPGFRTTISGAYEKSGYKLMCVGDQGFRVMTTNKPIRALADFGGVKIRTMENLYHLAFWKAVGSNPTPMNFGEVYIGLQQGTIDAQENPYEPTVSGKLYEQQDYVVETNHVPHLLTLIASKAFYDELDEEDRAILDEAARLAEKHCYEQTDQRMQDRLDIILASGTQILPVSPELHQQVVEACEPVYKQIRTAIGDELVDAMLAARDKQ